MVLSCVISEIKRYWSKIAMFFMPTLHSTPLGYRRNIAITFGIDWKKTRMMKPQTVKKLENTFSRFNAIPACDRQTGGQTDGQTDILPRIVRAYAEWKNHD